MYKDKIVIITGAAGGIGRYLVKGYADAGARVFAIDIKETTFDYYNVTFCHIDIKDAVSVKALFQNVILENGKPHILINNGAVSKFNKSIFEMTDEEFRQVIEVNLCGTFYCSRAFIHANSGESYGRIVNIASTRWAQNEPGWEAYGASKGGIVSLTASMAVSLKDTPITVNSISPGWIETESFDSLREIDHLQHPSGRVGKPEDIVKAAMFLSDPGNDFINGENIVIDGGMTKRMFYAE